MRLHKLTIRDLRNLGSVSLEGLAQVNVLFGANGSGKTTVLEAIHMLGMARSFRNGSSRSLIRHGQAGCIVQGQLRRVPEGRGGDVSVGIQRELSGGLLLRRNGETLRTVSSLAAEFPLQVFNAASFELLTGAPSARRQYLNWGVFHVEHRFLAAWQGFQRCIKQRNSCLRRDKLDGAELAVWTQRLDVLANEINDYRQSYFAQLAPVFREIAARLLPDLDELALSLRQGWDKRLSYAEALKASEASDRDRGFTHVGPQRADIRVSVGGYSAADTLSRGQQKLLVCSLKLAQGLLMQRLGVGTCAYLVDDLPAELDRLHAARVCHELETMGAQVFVTCVEAADIGEVWPQNGSALAMFHVEHGQIQREQ